MAIKLLLESKVEQACVCIDQVPGLRDILCGVLRKSRVA